MHHGWYVVGITNLVTCVKKISVVFDYFCIRRMSNWFTLWQNLLWSKWNHTKYYVTENNSNIDFESRLLRTN